MRGSKFWDTGGNFFLFFMSLPAFLWPTSFLMLAVTDLTKSFVSPEGTRVQIVGFKAFALDGGAL